MDLSRIDLITASSKEELQNQRYLESLIVKLGFNTEILTEQPDIVQQNGGGLLIWQYPNQFSKYLVLLQKFNITSYLEIGCRWGGTFVLTTEFLKRFNTIEKAIAVDIIDSPVALYCERSSSTHFVKMNSQHGSFGKFMKNNHFDLILIDGDHSYRGVKQDYEFSKNSGKIFVFHDIVNDACPGVIQFWNEMKTRTSEFDFYEFTDQYDDVFIRTGKKYLGIGVAVKK